MNDDNDVYVCNNFLTQIEYNALYNVIGSSYMDWYYNDTINFSIDGDDSDYNFQFTHDIYQFEKSGVLSLQNSEFKLSYKELIYPILTKLNAKALLRIKFNLNVRTNEIVVGGFHRDLPNISTPYKVAVFYLNTNNGYTLFKCGSKIESVANRIVIFDGNLEHSGTSCTNQKRRIVLNIDYIDKNEHACMFNRDYGRM